MSESTLDIILRSKKSGTGVKDTEQDLDGLEKTTSKLGNTAKAAAVGGIGLLAAGLSYAVDQAMETERVARATEQAIRSTGGAAGVTADEVGNLAGAMSDLTGMDDEAIQSAENVLLTFTSVGRDVFPQATQAALDMSAALGQDLQGSITMVGKALQDPIQGVSALARVGVNFNDSAKETIKRMVEMNDIAGAQKFILKELNTEFGGMAKALGDTVEGKFNKVKNAVDNLAASIGEKLLPVVGDAADAALTLMAWNDKLDKAVKGVNDNLVKSAPSWQAYAQGVLGASVAAGKLTQAQAQQIISGQAVTEGMWQYANVTQFLAQRSIPLLTEAQFEQTRAQEQAAAAAAAAVAESSRSIIESGNRELDQIMRNNQAVLANAAAFEREKAVKEEAAKADALYRSGIAETVGKVDSLAQSLMKATDAQAKQMLAQSALDTLKTAYENGTISQQGFQRATDAVLLRYDLATPKSLAMAQAQDAVTKAFLNGDLPLNAFITSAEKIPGLANDGKVTLKELAELGVRPTTSAVTEQDKAVNTLKNSWAAIPREVKTVYTIETNGQAPGSTGTGGTPRTGGRAGGGPVVERVPVNVDEMHREKFVPYQSGSIMPAGATIGSVTIPIYAQSGQSATEIAREVAIELGRLANIGTLTGAGLIGA